MSDTFFHVYFENPTEGVKAVIAAAKEDLAFLESAAPTDPQRKSEKIRVANGGPVARHQQGTEPDRRRECELVFTSLTQLDDDGLQHRPHKNGIQTTEHHAELDSGSERVEIRNIEVEETID